MKSHFKHGGKFALGIIGIILFVSIFTMLLWNSLIPSIFGLPEIGIFQTIGLLILFRLLFGNFGGGWKREGRHMMWRKKWSSMSKEERETFRSKSWGWGKHHHHHCHKPESDHENEHEIESDDSEKDVTRTKDDSEPKSV